MSPLLILFHKLGSRIPFQVLILQRQSWVADNPADVLLLLSMDHWVAAALGCESVWFPSNGSVLAFQIKL